MRRKESFDSVAKLYDQYRTGYPDDVVDAVIALSGVSAGTRVLEIGCGTGQLSVPLARYGVDLVAVELGQHLAARALERLMEGIDPVPQFVVTDRLSPPASGVCPTCGTASTTPPLKRTPMCSAARRSSSSSPSV